MGYSPRLRQVELAVAMLNHVDETTARTLVAPFPPTSPQACELVASVRFPPTLFAEYAKGPAAVRRVVAANPATPHALLVTMSKDRAALVRRTVEASLARNASLGGRSPFEVLADPTRSPKATCAALDYLPNDYLVDFEDVLIPALVAIFNSKDATRLVASLNRWHVASSVYMAQVAARIRPQVPAQLWWSWVLRILESLDDELDSYASELSEDPAKVRSLIDALAPALGPLPKILAPMWNAALSVTPAARLESLVISSNHERLLLTHPNATPKLIARVLDDMDYAGEAALGVAWTPQLLSAVISFQKGSAGLMALMDPSVSWPVLLGPERYAQAVLACCDSVDKSGAWVSSTVLELVAHYLDGEGVLTLSSGQASALNMVLAHPLADARVAVQASFNPSLDPFDLLSVVHLAGDRLLDLSMSFAYQVLTYSVDPSDCDLAQARTFYTQALAAPLAVSPAAALTFASLAPTFTGTVAEFVGFLTDLDA